MRTLSPEQIQALYAFTRRHFVAHYDLQTELVDHLALGIEAQWEAHPERDFDLALQTEFKKFGVFGFQEIVAQKRKAMERRYRGYIWQSFKAWFGWPKIALFIAITTVMTRGLYQLPDQESYHVALSFTFLAIAALGLAYLFMSRKNRELEMWQHGRKYLLAEMVQSCGSFGSMLPIPMYLIIPLRPNLSLYPDTNSLWLPMLLSACITAYVLLLWVVFRELPAKAEELLMDTYPDLRKRKDLRAVK